MSRPELQDYEYPPGLGGMRSRGNGERERMHGYQIPSPPISYNNLDRRQSLMAPVFNTYADSIPRSQEQREYDFGIDTVSGPNRHNASNTHMPGLSFSSFNHNLHRPSPPLPSSYPTSTALYHSTSPNDRELYLRHAQHHSANTPTLLPASNSNTSRSTLWWGELEVWMDEEYAKQVCSLMGWDPVNIKVPHPPPDPTTGQQANNPGYCFLTFPSPAHAASVLAQINTSGKANSITMPNSSRPFVLNWASSVPSTTNPSPVSSSFPPGPSSSASAPQQYPKEYSIFVGDLAPETSNSDLVAVFRNPVLGLRNDREPKFIRPFLSCKSAKIMLDPVTGVSRGYGFVRFTDEADQQRALIEMHGLYCLSRPMRISPATAKFKSPAATHSQVPPFDVSQIHFSAPKPPPNGDQQPHQQVTVALPLPPQTKSVSAPMAVATSNLSVNSNVASGSASGSSLGGSNSSNSLSAATGSSTSLSTSGFGSVPSELEETLNYPDSLLVQLAKQYASSDTTPLTAAGPGSVTPSYAHEAQLRQVVQAQQKEESPRFAVSEESWKHHAQARAILGNLIGPNGEQLTSTDPYNTTVFVGGLSPLISEETLRTFFAPFGDIHYVKVPVGKHCGFVQFVRKADAEKAIEKMQGFPIGGSRIRLSWGRSQYKAAQAAAQAAQAAQATLQHQLATTTPQVAATSMTQDQALQLLQKFAMQGYLPDGSLPVVLPDAGDSDSGSTGLNYANMVSSGILSEQMARAPLGMPRDDIPQTIDPYSGFIPRPEVQRALSNFSPFSPDPNLYATDSKKRESATTSRLDIHSHLSKAFTPGYYPVQTQELKGTNGGIGNAVNKVSPTATRPSSASRYGGFAESSDPPAPLNRAPGRAEAPISRPPSGQTSATAQGQGDISKQEFDVMHDLNGTLASLDLGRLWKGGMHEGTRNSASSGQFHPTGNKSSP